MNNKEKIIDILEANTNLKGEVLHESMFDDVADLILENLNIPVEQQVMPKISPIIWEKRYSETEDSDKHNRWMRIGRINGMTDGS